MKKYRIARVGELSASGELLSGPFELISDLSCIVEVSEGRYAIDGLVAKGRGAGSVAARLFINWLYSARLLLTNIQIKWPQPGRPEEIEYPIVFKNESDETAVVFVLLDDFPGS